MSKLQDLARSILGYGQQATDKFQKDQNIANEISNRYNPSVAHGAQLAGGDTQNIARMANTFLQKRNLPGQVITNELAKLGETSPEKQAAIKAYQGQPLSKQEQDVLAEKAFALVSGVTEPLSGASKLTKPLARSRLPEARIQRALDAFKNPNNTPAVQMSAIEEVDQIVKEVVPKSKLDSIRKNLPVGLERTQKEVDTAIDILNKMRYGGK